jgi:hypothetical protein
VFGKQNVEPALEKDPEMQKCYKKTVREEATFLETARDYFNQIPAEKHWICLKNYINQKCGSVMSLGPTPLLFSISRSFYDVRA